MKHSNKLLLDDAIQSPQAEYHSKGPLWGEVIFNKPVYENNNLLLEEIKERMKVNNCSYEEAVELLIMGYMMDVDMEKAK